MWEPLVLEKKRTLRGVKRFANHARFLAGDSSVTDMIPQLVGLVALNDAGYIDGLGKDFDFEQWKQGELWKSLKSRITSAPDTRHTEEGYISTVEGLMSSEHWARYRALVTGTGFHRSGSDTAGKHEQGS